MEAAQLLESYSEVKYVLCIKLMFQASSRHYRLYKINQVGILHDVPQVNALFRFDDIELGVQILIQDARKNLRIQEMMAVPLGVNDPITADVAHVAVRTRIDSPSSI
jgi:hypothetical protein